MKLVIDRAQLINALGILGRVVPKRSPAPAALCVLLKTGDKVLVLSGAGNGEMSAKIEIAAVDIVSPGEALVDFDRLNRLVATLDGQTVHVELTPGKLTIKTDSGSYTLFAGDTKDAIAFGEPTDEERESQSFMADGEALVEALTRVGHTVGRETSRYCFAGVYFKRDGKRLELVSTDGPRLSILHFALAKPFGPTRSAIVPGLVLPVLAAAVAEGAEIRVTLGENRVEFNIEKGRVVLRSPLIDGAFVPYDDVTPKEKDQKHSFLVKREALAAAIRRALPFTNEESRGVRFTFSEKNKALTVAARGVDLGEGSTTVTLDECAGGDLEIAFNPQFILDALEGAGGDAVRWTLSGSDKPGVFRAESFLCCVMPVTVPR